MKMKLIEILEGRTLSRDAIQEKKTARGQLLTCLGAFKGRKPISAVKGLLMASTIEVDSLENALKKFNEKVGYDADVKVGDCFVGGGSTPFAAAQLGMQTYSSDISAVACSMTWGALNIVGGGEKYNKRLQEIVREVEDEQSGTLIYAVEVRDPATDWMVPIIYNLPVKLIADHQNKRFEIVASDTLYSNIEGRQVTYEFGAFDYNDIKGGRVTNNLRPWDKYDFTPREDDIIQERLIGVLKRGKVRPATPEELHQEEEIKRFVGRNFKTWCDRGWINCDEIPMGRATRPLFRDRGLRYWSNLFLPRQAKTLAMLMERFGDEKEFLFRILQYIEKNSRCCGVRFHTFYNQAFNLFFNFTYRPLRSLHLDTPMKFSQIHLPGTLKQQDARGELEECDIWHVDPPYTDAVNYDQIEGFFGGYLKKGFKEYDWSARGNGAEGWLKNVASKTKDDGLILVHYWQKRARDAVEFVKSWDCVQLVNCLFIAGELDSALRHKGSARGNFVFVFRKKSYNIKVSYNEFHLRGLMHEQLSRLYDQLGADATEEEVKIALYTGALRALQGVEFAKVRDRKAHVDARNPHTFLRVMLSSYGADILKRVDEEVAKRMG